MNKVKNVYSGSKGPELLDDMEARLAALLQQHGVKKDKAMSVALTVTREMSWAWGGQNIYFPAGKTRWASERDSKLFTEFTGDNHADLAKKYNLTVSHIYRIVKRYKEKRCEQDCFE